MSRLDAAVERASALLRRALTTEGYVASPAAPHYRAVWARDAAMTCLGASRSGDPRLVAGVETTLRTLARLAGPHGQVPAAYWPDRGYWDWGENGTTDASAWFVIALTEHVAATGREAIAAELWPAATDALAWLYRQDVTRTGLVSSPAGGDWMDSSLNRSGRVFHVNVLYYWAAAGAGRLAARLAQPPTLDAAPIAASVEGFFWPTPGRDLASLHVPFPYAEGAIVEFPHPLAAAEFARVARPDRMHYLASVSYGRFIDRCDVLAHCLAIACGLVGGERAGLVLDHLDATGCADPYPSKSWPQPFRPGEDGLDTRADELQDERWRNPPGSYHNGAVWPFIGAIHAVANARSGRNDRARELMEGVAAANALDDWGFPEWIEVPSAIPRGARDQVWNAGALLWAHSQLG